MVEYNTHFSSPQPLAKCLAARLMMNKFYNFVIFFATHGKKTFSQKENIPFIETNKITSFAMYKLQYFSPHGFSLFI